MDLKNTNYKNKIMIAALAATLLFMPLSANAYSDLQDAILNATDGDTYTLSDNQTIDNNLGILNSDAKNFTIDGTSKKYNIAGNKHSCIRIEDGQTLSIVNIGEVSGFKSSKGGFLYNKNGTIFISNSNFKNNEAMPYEGGVIFNNGIIGEISNSTFSNNIASSHGGAILNMGTTNKISNSTFSNNNAFNGGAIFNNNTIYEISNSTFSNNNALNGGAIFNSGVIKKLSGTFEKNRASTLGGAIYNIEGQINIVADTTNTTFNANTDKNGLNAIYNLSSGNNSTINLNAGNKSIIFNDGISGGTSNITNQIININKSNVDTSLAQDGSAIAPTTGTVAINNKVENQTVNMYDGTLLLGSSGVNFGTFNNSNFNFYGGTLSTQDGSIKTTNLGNLTLNSDMNLAIDADLSNNGSIDTISADSFSANGHIINISDIKIINSTTEKTLNIPFASDSSIMSAIKCDNLTAIYSPIYKYLANYDPNTGIMNFGLQSGGSSYEDYNPAAYAPAVAAQVGGYITQLNSYNQAFRNMDMYMLMPQAERTAMKLRNKYASAARDGITYELGQRSEDYTNIWFNPYATFENIPLKNGPKVSNVEYGTYFGGNSPLIDLGHGWDGMWGAYIGYNGSHQAYDGISVYQNGGSLGLVGMAYKDNFFIGTTINSSASNAQASTMYGQDNFTMLMAGIAAKTGYNFELAQGKFIIQPSYLMSYSFVNTFDFTSKSGARIDSDPLNAIQIEPGIKFIGNLKNGWQPYAGISVVWNIMDKSKFQAQDVTLPEVSVKPFVKYGVGVRKLGAKDLQDFSKHT